ncbi:MAG TPA: hypothetical protein VMM76_00780 [Pirellulaceae bacterium]|nr:hypothetical protein [Pirellulaceae bacterium]
MSTVTLDRISRLDLTRESPVVLASSDSTSIEPRMPERSATANTSRSAKSATDVVRLVVEVWQEPDIDGETGELARPTDKAVEEAIAILLDAYLDDAEFFRPHVCEFAGGIRIEWSRGEKALRLTVEQDGSSYLYWQLDYQRYGIVKGAGGLTLAALLRTVFA